VDIPVDDEVPLPARWCITAAKTMELFQIDQSGNRRAETNDGVGSLNGGMGGRSV
jgi:hypothetical protein